MKETLDIKKKRHISPLP